MKRRWKFLVGVVIAALLYFILRKINFPEVWRLVVEANNFYFLLAFLAYGFSFLIYTARMKYVIRPVVKTDFWFLAQNTIMGTFVGTITPASQIGGDPVKAHYIGKKYRKKRSAVFGAILVDRLYVGAVSVFFVILSGFFAFALLPLSDDLLLLLQGTLFFILFSVTVIIAIYFVNRDINFSEIFGKIMPFLRRKKVGKRNPKGKFKKIFSEHFENFSSTFKKIALNKKIAVVAILFSIAYWILNFLVPYFLFLSFGHKVSFILVMVVYSVTIILAEIGFTPGGSGLIEGATFLTYSLAGIDSSLALAVTLLTRIIFYFYALVLGGISLIHLERTID